VTILLLRIFGPQIAGLAAYAALRAALRRRDLILPQLGAVLTAALAAAALAMAHLDEAALSTAPRIGAFVTLEVFVALLAQLLIAAAEPE
jgi:hypothetical protein